MATKEEFAIFSKVSMELYRRGKIKKADDYFFMENAIAMCLETHMYLEEAVTLHTKQPKNLYHALRKALKLSYEEQVCKATIRLINDPELYEKPFLLIRRNDGMFIEEGK